MEVAAPGLEKEDFMITLEGNLLTISSTKKNETEDRTGQYMRKEFSYQSFSRSFELAKDVVDEERIQARYENGVLKLNIPKTEKAKKQEPKLIEIQ